MVLPKSAHTRLERSEGGEGIGNGISDLLWINAAPVADASIRLPYGF